MKQLTPHSPALHASTFAVDFERCMQRLRGALTDLLAVGGEDARLPQELSRNCKINKNLAWKVCKIINSTDPYTAAQHVPGSAGIRILLAAFENRGTPAAPLEQVNLAVQAFDQMIRVHVGDRGNLELYIGSIQEGGVYADELEPMRKMAFQGNSVMWGVQARAAFTLKAVSPTAGKPERADLTTVGGLVDFRRLRETASWPLLRQLTLSENVEIGQSKTIALDPDYAGKGAPLVPEFCSKPLPPTRTVIEGDSTIFELCEGPVGNTAALDVTYGSLDRDHVPVRSDTDESVGEHYCRVDTPVELLQFDLLVHRSLPFEMPPKLVTCSTLQGELPFPLSDATRQHLPGISNVQSLGNTLHGFATPHIQGYGQLVTKTCERIGLPLEEFDGYRVTLTYPPLPSILVMYHLLGKAR